MPEQIEICVLAAGVGSRMKSDKPKVLQTLAGRPLLDHLLATIRELEPDAVHVVIGQGADQVQAAFSSHADIHWVHQRERLGTGHAVQQAAPHLQDDSRTLILLGDAPLISTQTLDGLLQSTADLTVLTVEMDDPFNYGRIIREADQLVAIIEEKDASPAQRLIREINTGVMCVRTRLLKDCLSKLTNDNAQGEYLLTDIVQLANQSGASVSAHKSHDPVEVTGINTFAQLAALERQVQKNIVKELMDAGVQIMDPARCDVRGKLTAGRGVFIDINVIFEGEVILGDNVSIGPNCVIKDCSIGSGTVVKANSVLEGAQVADNCSVGPFARLRPGADLAEGVGIGNFVEVKKSTLGKGAKASHLAYLGDATIGAGVNIGAGTITCNYDGVNKWQTEIGEGVFVGSNTSLVAPVKIGAGATIGAGSTITREVDPDVLAVGRAKQITISNWQRPFKKKD
ncbi:MAG: bifunctional UDP-N-acetylglucosamine diphosphorylase/glucosamine-1-phosphate N-acetyltransferase GlmU [Proteobacteria bacterium]|nr:bifunctional UDP-N-acetylglucosamine diphosphorylase/glucosamine-1-phosphate N-acetyltransferase GlmU [Pseudomonadota bacterium]